MGLLALVSLLRYKMGISHNKMLKDVSETLLICPRPRVLSRRGMCWVSVLLLGSSPLHDGKSFGKTGS